MQYALILTFENQKPKIQMSFSRLTVEFTLSILITLAFWYLLSAFFCFFFFWSPLCLPDKVKPSQGLLSLLCLYFLYQCGLLPPSFSSSRKVCDGDGSGSGLQP